MSESITTYVLLEDGYIPNNSELPLLVYKAVLHDDIESTFHENNWKNSWHGGVFDFHHYHSTVHEAVGIEAGQAVLKLGGENGVELEVEQGDLVVIPAGTGHKYLNGSDDFQVVGAYPNGADYDLKKANSEDFSQAISEIKQVPLPEFDPVYKNQGPVFDYWKK